MAGRWLMRTQKRPALAVRDSTNYPISGGSNVTYEWISGVLGVNTTENTEYFNTQTEALKQTTVFQFSTTSSPRSVIQARPGHTLTFTVYISVDGTYPEYQTGWVNYGYGAGWVVFGNTSLSTTGTNIMTYTIPPGTAAGNYALAFANNYNTASASPTSTETYKSILGYTLQVW